MIETPVRSSPAMIARSIGAAPRQRGSNEGWTFSIGYADSSGSLISPPNAHTQTASGRADAIRLPHVGVVDRGRLGDLDPELGRRLGDRRARDATATATGAVGSRHDQRRPMRGGGQASQHRDRERRRAEEDGSHRSGLPVGGLHATRPAAASRSARIASLRCSRVVRSRIRTPSRWSISCWITRASSPEASTTIGSPALVERADADVDGPLDVDEHPGEAEAALLHRLELLARPLDLGVDERRHGRLMLHAVDEHAVEHARPGARRGRHRAHRPSAAPIRSTSERQRLVEPLDLPGSGLQHRVAELADVGERGRAAARELGIELELLAPRPRPARPRRSPRRRLSRCRRPRSQST